jgi:hypothetical protein
MRGSLIALLAMAMFFLANGQGVAAGGGIVLKQEQRGAPVDDKEAESLSDTTPKNFPDKYKEKVVYPSPKGFEYHCASDWAMLYLRTMIEVEEGVELDGGFPHCTQSLFMENRKQTCLYASREEKNKSFTGEMLLEFPEQGNRCRFISAEYRVQERPSRDKPSSGKK